MTYKMNKWCKIFEVDDQQVLFWYEVNTDKETDYILHQVLYLDGIWMDLAIAGIKRHMIQKAFDAVNKDDAVRAITVAKTFLGENALEMTEGIPSDDYNDI